MCGSAYDNKIDKRNKTELQRGKTTVREEEREESDEREEDCCLRLAKHKSFGEKEMTR